jgi:glycosyltransferase involved in cell wall biosynthesis
MILGIDASTPGSGGARRHIIELLKAFSPEKHGFKEVKIWGVEDLLDQLPDVTWLVKRSHPYLNKGFFYRTFWQLFLREKAFRGDFDVLFSPFGTYTGSCRPYITMSRNMLIFDKVERSRFGFSVIRIKLRLLYYIQKKSFQNANGIIFISKFASEKINKQLDLSRVTARIIHHGISNDFINEPRLQMGICEYNFEQPFRFLYVSTIWVYKHPWNVVEAIGNLRRKGYPIRLDIVGNNEQKKAGKKLQQKLEDVDSGKHFIFWHKQVNLAEVSKHYHSANAFVFASTCENMPNILIEAMTSGLPIACSSFGPMPEFLKDGGLYMDPTSVADIEMKLEKILLDKVLRERMVAVSYDESKKYNWQKCADETFSFLNKIANKNNK